MAKTGFGYRIAEFKTRGRRMLGHDPCTCWDCLRAEGLTPPYGDRDRHPQRYPHAVFARSDDGHTGDRGGHPLAGPVQREQHKAGSASEGRQFREAIRNREAM